MEARWPPLILFVSFVYIGTIGDNYDILTWVSHKNPGFPFRKPRKPTGVELGRAFRFSNPSEKMATVALNS